MKNIKVSMKLMLSFGIVLFLAAAIGIVGIFGLTSMRNASEDLYNSASPLYELARAMEDFERARTYTTEITIHTGNIDAISVLEIELVGATESFERNMDIFKLSLRTKETEEIWASVMNDYEKIIKTGAAEILTNAVAGVETLKLVESLKTLDETSETITAGLISLIVARNDYMDATNQDNVRLGNRLLVIIVSVIAAASITTVILAVYVSGIISKPLIALANFMKKAGSTGDITLSPVDIEVIGKYAQAKDEIGQCIGNTAAFVDHIGIIANILNSIAKGDLSNEGKPLSEEDVMGQAIYFTVNSLNQMFGEINSSSTQVDIGSKQVADGAQALAQGSTQQAASLQELSSSIAEIAAKTKSNATMAEKAALLAGKIRNSAEEGSSRMNEMVKAVGEINEASSSISKVIKVIDDIAFQTNILALNAAVEAARAGQHGKGFAVVAEEVRNLAAKSAEAAKDTGSLIENSIEKATLGVRIAGETAESLTEIVSGISESGKIIDEIAHSSEEQSVGVDQINIGIDQVAQVVQQNSATAEESAAASEEMSSQSSMLQELISRFKLKDSAQTQRISSRSVHAIPGESTLAYSKDGDFGKY